MFLYKKSLKQKFEPGFWLQNEQKSGCVLGIHKGYFEVETIIVKNKREHSVIDQ